MRFRLAPNLSTLDDLERPKCPLVEVNKNSGGHQKNFNEDRLMLSATKCTPVGVVSKSIRYMRICIRIYIMFCLIITARCYAKRGYEIACRLSVCVIFTQVENNCTAE